MNGWIAFVLLALGAAALLWLLKLPRSMWMTVAAALVLGAAGYAWQGRPGLAAHPVVSQTAGSADVDEALTHFRETMFGRFNVDDKYFIMADAMTRSGSPAYASMAMLGGVRQYPQDPALWTGLGLKIAEQDANIVSPTARYAFDKAMALAPKHPGPPFFLGLAYLRANDFPTARIYWSRALALTPNDAPYRNEILARLYLLDRFIQMQEAQKKAQPAPPR